MNTPSALFAIFQKQHKVRELFSESHVALDPYDSSTSHFKSLIFFVSKVIT